VEKQTNTQTNGRTHKRHRRGCVRVSY